MFFQTHGALSRVYVRLSYQVHDLKSALKFSYPRSRHCLMEDRRRAQSVTMQRAQLTNTETQVCPRTRIRSGNLTSDQTFSSNSQNA